MIRRPPRSTLLDIRRQRQMCIRDSIGTVVFPDAELKLFVTASPEVRAKRRVDELEAKGIPASYEEVLENVKKRDYIDSTREESPLRQADDALVLDNSHMTLEEQKAWLLEQYHKAIGS